MRTGWWFATSFMPMNVWKSMYESLLFIGFFLLVYMLFCTEPLPTSPLVCSWYWYSGIVCAGCFLLSMIQVVWWRRRQTIFVFCFGSKSRHQTTRWFAHLNIGILIKGWGNLYASCPHDVMDCGLWEIWLCQPQWSFAMTLLIYLYLVTSCMLKCISNTRDVVYISEFSFKDLRP